MVSLERWTMLVMATLLTACTASKSKLYETNRVTDQTQAGYVTVSPVAIGPWSNYSAALQPNFSLSADDAVKQAIPTTSFQLYALLEALGIQGQVGLPSSTSGSSMTSSLANGVTTKSGTTTDTTAAGTLPANNAPTPAGSRTAAQLPDLVATAPTTDPAVDPILKYRVGAALYQELKYLDQYLNDIPRQKGYKPYLLRLQITEMPYLRGAPYDAYVDVSFMSYVAGAVADEDHSIPDAKCVVPANVIPILLTDDLERTTTSRAVEAVDGLAKKGQCHSDNNVFRSSKGVF